MLLLMLNRLQADAEQAISSTMCASADENPGARAHKDSIRNGLMQPRTIITNSDQITIPP